MLGATEVAQFENTWFGIKQQVLWFYVSMTDTQRMDVSQTPEELVHVQLDETYRNCLLRFTVMTSHFVDRLRNKLQDQVQKHLIFLKAKEANSD
jgi:hypothetical protein